MHVTYLMIFFSLCLFGQEKAKFEPIPTPKTIEDFEHQFKGCLENSECDQIMGLQLSRWKNLMSNLKEDGSEGSKKSEQIELFRIKNGIPVEFYTNERSQQGFKPLLFNSPCKNHNLEKGHKVLRGISFIKSITQNKAVVWRDQTQIEVPVGEILIPQSVTVYFDNYKTIYKLPIDDQPILIKDKNLYILKEDHDVFYVLKISPEGEWKIVNMDISELSRWEEKKKDIECPGKNDSTIQGVFKLEICKSIWDEDQKKNVTIKMERGCSI